MVTGQTRPKDAREWKGTVGLDAAHFSYLASQCEQAYIVLYGGSFAERLAANPKGHLAQLRSVADLIFFTLSILKSGITFDYAGFIYQLDQANAHRRFVRGLCILHYVLDSEGYLPLRTFQDVADFQLQCQHQSTLIIDATEQRIQRPQDHDEQRATYSGKKKGNTVKAMIIRSLDRYVWYVSRAYVGASHNYSLLKAELEPGKGWFANLSVRLDLGYQGFATGYPEASTYLPT